MRGDMVSGWFPLATDFPPTINTVNDSAKLKPNESPACYGVDCQSDGVLKTGTCLTGAARTTNVKTISTVDYNWYYNRLWRFSGSTLFWGAPEYDDVYFPQDLGKMQADATIVNIMPCLQDSLWVATATGSHIIGNASDQNGRFVFNQFSQEMTLSTALYGMTLQGIPFAANAQGVFSWDGRQVKEWTRAVRNSPTPFNSNNLTADYDQRYVIAASKFVIDTENGKLFDYSTAGFLFTTRTLSQTAGFAPYIVDAIEIIFDPTDTADGSFSWATKSDENDWYAESDVIVQNLTTQTASKIIAINNPIRNVSSFALRLSALSSNLNIRSIMIRVKGLATGSITG